MAADRARRAGRLRAGPHSWRGLRVARRRAQRSHNRRAGTPPAAVRTRRRGGGPAVGHPRRADRSSSTTTGTGPGRPVRGGCLPPQASGRAHPRRRPGRVDRGALETGAVVARARRCDGAPRRPVRRCPPNFDGRAGDGGGYPARRACTRTFPRRRRADRSGGRTHPRSAATCRAPACWPGDGTFLGRDLARLFDGVDERRAPTAAPASPHRWSSPRSLRPASTLRCIPARGPNGVRTLCVPSRRARSYPQS